MKKRFVLLHMFMFLLIFSGWAQVTTSLGKLSEGNGAMSYTSSNGGPFYEEDNTYFIGTRTVVLENVTYTEVYRSVLTFDCDEIPAKSFIKSATLKFQPTRQNTSISSATNIKLLNKNSDPVPSNWFSEIDEGTVVKNNQTNSNSGSIDITELVNTAYNSSGEKKTIFWIY